MCFFLILVIYCFGFSETTPEDKNNTLSDSTQVTDANTGEEKQQARDSVQSAKLTEKQKRKIEREKRRKKRKEEYELTGSAHKSMYIGSSNHTHKSLTQRKPNRKGPLKPQTACPVMGGPIDKRFYYDYEGMRVYVCCEGCIYQYKLTPTLYIKAMKRYGEKPEIIKKED